MTDKNPMRVEKHFRDGSVEKTELHFSPPNGLLQPTLGYPSSGAIFSIVGMRPDGVYIMRED